MFIKIEDGNDLKKKLDENKDRMIVIHYNCHDCDDEQVTGEVEASFNLEQLNTHGYLVLHLDCTECGTPTRILSPEYIQGIELI